MAESSADKITSYSMTAIPGLVQTEEYATALFEACGRVSPDEIKAAVRFRMERQAILRRPNRPQECVEVAFAQAVCVRDSKNTAGPELRFGVEAWQEFIGAR